MFFKIAIPFLILISCDTNQVELELIGNEPTSIRVNGYKLDNLETKAIPYERKLYITGTATNATLYIESPQGWSEIDLNGRINMEVCDY